MSFKGKKGMLKFTGGFEFLKSMQLYDHGLQAFYKKKFCLILFPITQKNNIFSFRQNFKKKKKNVGFYNV